MTVAHPRTDHQDRSAPTSTVAAPRVCFQGELGAYGHEALMQQWQGQATAVPSKTFQSVIDNVARGFAEFGIIPAWNSTVGEIPTGVAALREGTLASHPTCILGDIRITVKHQLLGLRGSNLDDIRSVASHPAALAQCTTFLRNHPQIEPVPFYDTAGAALQLAVSGRPAAAAIAGRHAARLYDLAILQADIQNAADNVTQFLVIARSSDDTPNACYSLDHMDPASGIHVNSTDDVRW